MTGRRWRFSARSERAFAGVHRDLVRVVRLALERSPVDFAVHDGWRTLAEQRALYEAGASRLDGERRRSRHQDGCAVDLVPYVGGRLLWEWAPLEQVATAMAEAAREVDVPLRWGGRWARIDTIRGPVKRSDRGWDGPHFELPTSYCGRWLG